MRCYIRVDGTPKIGMGHVSRCLTIAIELARENIIPSFIIATNHPKNMIKGFGFECIEIKGLKSCSEEEESRIEEISKNEEEVVFLVDNYNATDQYLTKLENIGPTFYIDGMYKCRANISGVINYNAAADINEYKKRFLNTNTDLLIGLKFAPVKYEFLQARRERLNIQESRKQNSPINILVTTGATDQPGFISKFCKRVIQNKCYAGRKYHVVLGKLYNDVEAIKRLLEPFDCFMLYCDIPDMYKLMAKCDVAISAAGTTIYELLCVGLPTIAYGTVDVHSTFSALGSNLIWIGNLSDKDLPDIESIVEMAEYRLERLIGDQDLMKNMSNSAIELIDGEGARRIAKEMLGIVVERKRKMCCDNE